MSVFYTTTFLPFGKFYNRLGGNVGMLLAYLYVFAYLGLPSIKKNITFRAVEDHHYYVIMQYTSSGLSLNSFTDVLPVNYKEYDSSRFVFE